MNERSKRISRLKADQQSRQSYVFSKVAVLVPSQIKALRLTSQTPTQKELATEVGAHQSRLSMLEQPGAANVTLETLAWIASIHKVGLIVKFASHNEMVKWENSYSQDEFSVIRLDDDEEFLQPGIHAKISTLQVGSMANGVFGIQWCHQNDDEFLLKARTNVPSDESFRNLELVGNG